jgi:hypothetical protein
MKRITLLLVIVLFTFIANAQEYSWAKRISGANSLVPSFNVNVSEMIAWNDGEIYVSGKFSGTVDFDTSAGVNNKTSQGVDGFVACYDANGSLNWVYTTNAAGDEEVAAIGFNQSVVYTLNCVVKIGANSMRVDRISRGTGNLDISSAVCSSTGTINVKEINNDGYIVGGYTGVFTIGSTTLTSAGLSDGFCIRTTNNATAYTFNAAASFGSTGEDIVNCISDDYLGGSFSGTVVFGSFTRISAGGKDGFFFKYNPTTLVPLAGTTTNSVGGVGDDEVLTLADIFLSGANNHHVMAGGYFTDVANFNSGGNLTSNGGKDGFIVAYTYLNSNNSYINMGSNRFGSTNDDEITNLSILNDYSSVIHYCGIQRNSSGGSVPFVGSRNRTNNSITSYSGDFVPASITTFVKPVSVKFLGGNVFYAGDYNGTTDFNQSNSVTTNLTSNNGGTNAFIQRSNFCLNSATTPTINGPSSVCDGQTITLTLTGTINDNNTWNWYEDSCGGTLVGTGANLTITPTSTKSYYVKAVGGCVADGACSSVKTVNFKYVADNGITLTGSTLTATQTPLPGASYAWINCANNFTMSGATSQSYTPTTSGIYRVRIFGSSLCQTVESECITVNLLSTNDFEKLGLKLYPNPTVDYFVIEGENEIKNINVYNLLGQKVKTFNQPSSKYEMVELSPGTYIIEVNTENATAKTKIIKE